MMPQSYKVSVHRTRTAVPTGNTPSYRTGQYRFRATLIVEVSSSQEFEDGEEQTNILCNFSARKWWIIIIQTT